MITFRMKNKKKNLSKQYRMAKINLKVEIQIKKAGISLYFNRSWKLDFKKQLKHIEMFNCRIIVIMTLIKKKIQINIYIIKKEFCHKIKIITVNIKS